MNKLKSIYASAYGAAIAIFVVTAITIGTELSPTLKNWLTNISGHHWVTKSYMSLIVFIFFYYLFSLTKKTVSEHETRKALLVLQTFAILGSITILGFFMYEFFAR